MARSKSKQKRQSLSFRRARKKHDERKKRLRQAASSIKSTSGRAKA